MDTRTGAALLASDRTEVVDAWRAELTALGYAPCLQAATGAEALALADQYRPALTLIDRRLGGAIDARTVALRIRAEIDGPALVIQPDGLPDDTPDPDTLSGPLAGQALKLAIALAGRDQEAARLRREVHDLHEQHGIYRLISDTSAELIAVVDRDGHRIYNSPSYQTVLGYSPDDLKGSWAFEQIHPDDRPKVMQAAQAAAESGIGRQLEYRIRHQRGDWRTIRSASTAIRGPSGEISHLVISAHDVTDEKRLEAEMRTRDRRLVDVVDRASDIIYQTDEFGRFAFYNHVVTDLLGYDLRELMGRHYLDVVHPAFRREAQNHYRRQFAHRVPSTYLEFIIQAKDGREVWVGQNVQLLTEGERIVGFQAVARDITERKHAEAMLHQTLRESQVRQSLLFQQTPLAAIEWSPALEIIDWNPAAERLFGYGRNEMLGRPAAGLIASDPRDLTEQVTRTLKTGGFVATMQNRTRDGRSLICEWHHTPLIDDSGRVLGVASLALDTTEQRQAEVAVRSQSRFLEALRETTIALINQRGQAETLSVLVERAAALAATAHVCVVWPEGAGRPMALQSGSGTFAGGLLPAAVQSAIGAAWESRSTVIAAWRPPGVAAASETEADTATFAAVPLALGARIIGVLGIGYDDARALTPIDVSHLEQFVEVGAIALENERLYDSATRELSEREQLERRLHELLARRGRQAEQSAAVAGSIAQVLGSAADLDGLYRQAAALVVSHFGYDQVRIYRWSRAADRPWLVAEATVGHPLASTVDSKPADGIVLQAAITGRSVLAEPGARGESSGELAVPIRLGADVIGVLDIGHAGDRLSVDDQLSMEGLSSLIAVAAESMQLFQQVSGSLEASARMNTARSFADILETLGGHTELGRNAARIAILYFNEPWTAEVVPEFALSVASRPERLLACGADAIPVRSTSLQWLFADDEPIVIEDTETDLRIDDRSREGVIRVPGARTVVSVPLITAGQRIGMIMLHLAAPTSVTDDALRQFVALARQAAAATANLQLVSELEERIQARTTQLSVANTQLTAQNSFMSALHETALGLMNRLDLSELLESIVARAASLSHTSHAFMFQLDAGGESMTMVVGTGFFRQRNGDVIRPGQGAAGAAWQNGERLALNDYAQWPGRFADPVFDQLSSLLAVPLKSGRKVLGVLGLGHTAAEPVFSDLEVDQVIQFAELASIALDNAQLFFAAQEEVIERTRAEERMRQQNEFLSALNETALALIAQRDTTEILRTLLARANALFQAPGGFIHLLDRDGQAMRLTVGTGLAGRLSSGPIERGSGLAGAVWETGRPLVLDDYRTWHRRPDGDQSDFIRAVAAVPLTSGGEVIGVLGVAHEKGGRYFTFDDVHALEQFAQMASIALYNARLIAEAQAGRDAALDAARLKSEFLANMSHEIRTPMNAVIGMTGLLANTVLEAHQRHYVESIRNASDTLLTIINDILDLSKMEAGKMRLENIEFEPLIALEEAAELLAPRAREKNLALLTFTAPDVPTSLRGDPVRLRQVLINLIGNAVKFTERGEVVVTAEIAQQDNNQITLRFAVQDTGVGIAAAALPRLFEPFTQADGSTTRRFGGTGLGLSIVKRLAELMGGTIEVTSAEGAGSTFSFTARFERVALAAPVGALPADLARLHVLAVDDSDASRSILRRYIESWGMACDEAAGAEHALADMRAAVAARNPYDVAIVDLVMAGADGFRFAQRVRDDEALRRTKLILLTAFDEHGLGERALGIGFAAYLTKPIKQSFLFDAIARAMHELTGSASRAGDAATAATRAESTAPARFAPGTAVLVAEDHPVNQEVAVLQLRHLGITAHVVGNGREAVAGVANHTYGLVLMDCQMPDMDGYEAARAIRRAEAATGAHLPIIAMTAHAMQGDRELCQAAGMDDYIAKPVTLEKLQAVLSVWLPAATAARPAAAGASAAEPAGELPSVDVKVIADLKEMSAGDASFIRRLITAYLAQTEELLPAIRQAIARGDAEALRQSAHKLKGGSASLGVKALAARCLELENLGRAGLTDGAGALAAQAATEYARAKAALEHAMSEE
ncbi:MAG: PAS domain S-box protein [Chloroflexi bacterium]|nr:PAS domain S-box protein [Chloroflexota bacterium]